MARDKNVFATPDLRNASSLACKRKLNVPSGALFSNELPVDVQMQRRSLFILKDKKMFSCEHNLCSLVESEYCVDKNESSQKGRQIMDSVSASA